MTGLFFILTFQFGMKNLKLLISFLFLVSTLAATGQVTSDSLLAKDNVMFSLPTISVNFGFNHFMGDVPLNETGPSPFSQIGYGLTVTQSVTNYLDASLFLYAGNVKGENTVQGTNLNFRTTLFSQQLSVEYNFYPLLKPDDKGRQLIRPYLGFGVGLLSFRSKGDLKNENGVTYQYWSDGSVRAEIEGEVDPSESTILERDFEYETDLRDANLDGLRKYSQLAFSLPLNAGIRFQITKSFGLNAGFSYILNFTDFIDNVSDAGVGARKGSKGFDNHLFGSVGVSVFLGRTKHSSKSKRFENEILAQKETSISSESNDKSETNEETKSNESFTQKADELSNASKLEPLDSKQAKLSEEKADIDEINASVAKVNKELESVKSSLATKKKLSKSTKEQIETVLENHTSNIESVNELLERKAPANSIAPKKLEGLNFSKDDIASIKINSETEVEDFVQKLEKDIEQLATLVASEEKILKQKGARINQLSLLDSEIELLEKTSAANSEMNADKREEKAKQLTTELEQIAISLDDSDNAEKSAVSDFKNRIKQAISGEGIGNELAENSVNAAKTEQEATNIGASRESNSTTDGSSTNSKTNQELLDSERAQLSQQKTSIAQIETDISNVNSEIKSVKSSLSADKNLSQSAKQKIETVLKSHSKNLESVTELLANKTSDERQKENNLEQLNFNKNEISSIKLTSKTDAEDVLEKLENDIEKVAAFVALEEKSISQKRARIDQLNVIQAKVKLLEKMSGSDSNVDTNKRKASADQIISELNQLTALFDESEGLEKSVAIELKSKIQDVVSEKTADNLLDKDSLANTTDKPQSENKTSSSTTPKSTSANKGSESNQRSVEEIENTPPKQTGGFHWADVNQNGWISPDEVLYFIDMLFEGESEQTVEDIQNLIDYYFDQE